MYRGVTLGASIAEDNAVAHVSRGTRRGLDFEFHEPNPKLKLGCNIWQILGLTIVLP